METKTIMFTDRVGSSAGAATLGDALRMRVQAALDRLTREVVEEHAGTLVKFLGDGHLITFPSASAALRAGWEIVQRCAGHNAGAPAAEHIHLRVGMDAGDVEVMPDGDVRGHAADMAKRVESAAPADGVACSARVRDLLPPGFGTLADLGERELKGAPERVRLLAVESLPPPEFRNPFVIGRPVHGPRDFHGRERELTSIFARLGTGGSVSITGPRLIGKSSLLRHLLGLLPTRMGPAWRGVYLDMGNPRVRTATGALEEIQRAVEMPNPARTLADFAGRLEQVHERGLRLALGWDGMEAFLRLDQEFDRDFFEGLRSLAGEGKVVLLCTSRSSLRELFDAGKLLSPLYNIMMTVALGHFSDAEAARFVSWPRFGGVFDVGLQKEVLAQAENHPLRLQCYCARAAESLHHGSGKWEEAWSQANGDVQGMLGE